jgi:Dolichyl-phosphate-mannose-protein mannosyltransferase
LTRSPFRAAAWVLLAVLLTANVYRAATQSITFDEARTWQLYLAGPFSAFFELRDPANHFLATLLFKISTMLFGNSEFALRLPSVLAGAWFFWTILKLCGLMFGEGGFLLLGCSLLALNPILLDFLVAARGYGLAVAALFWALYQTVLWIGENRGVWKVAGGCLIAVAANLTMLAPVFVLALVIGTLSLRGGKRWFALAALLALAIAFLGAAPHDRLRGFFYVGAPSALGSLKQLTRVSFAYGGASSSLRPIEQFFAGAAVVVLPFAVIAALIAGTIALRSMRSPVAVGTVLSALIVVGSALLLVSAHWLIGIPYPEDRTGLYLVPLSLLAALGFARILREQSRSVRWIGCVVAVVLASFALDFAAEWNVKSFWVWRRDADTKPIFEKIEERKPASGQLHGGVSPIYDPVLNYYRLTRHAFWLAPFESDGLSGERDFYVLSPRDQKSNLPPLRILYRGPVSGAILAIH